MWVCASCSKVPIKVLPWPDQDIVALEKGKRPDATHGDVIYRFGNEIRSMCHPKFMRPLYNRLGHDFDVPEATKSIV